MDKRFKTDPLFIAYEENPTGLEEGELAKLDNSGDNGEANHHSILMVGKLTLLHALQAFQSGEGKHQGEMLISMPEDLPTGKTRSFRVTFEVTDPITKDEFVGSCNCERCVARRKREAN